MQTLLMYTGILSQEVIDIPATPSFLYLEALATTIIDVTWTSISGISSYSLERGLTSNYSDATLIYSGTTNNYRDEGLTSGTTYYYRVKANGLNNLSSAWKRGSQTPLEAGLYSYPADDYTNDATNPSEYSNMGLL